MESFFEIIFEVIKWLFKIILYILRELFIDFILFNVGYYSLKILTTGSFPKSREDAIEIYYELMSFGMLILFLAALAFSI